MDNSHREYAARRIWEGVIATVVGGLIVWFVTSTMSRPVTPAIERVAGTVAPPAAPSNDRTAVAVAPPRTTGRDVSPGALPTSAPSVPRAQPAALPPAVVPGPAAVPPAVAPATIPPPSILLYEDFARCREGALSGWGPQTIIKKGSDQRNWVVPNVDGVYPIGRAIQLPSRFRFMCRYSIYMPEVTRGALGWWKEPVASKISFIDNVGMKHSIDWLIRYGNESTWLDPLGAIPAERKYYHNVRLPSGTAKEVGIVLPTGLLQINRDNNAIELRMDGQLVLAENIGNLGQWVAFEIDAVRVKYGTLSFTDFKIAR
jgi:hypothetical protein